MRTRESTRTRFPTTLPLPTSAIALLRTRRPPWDPFALVPAAASLPTALVQYHRERCGADFDRFVSCLRTEALVDAVLDRERAQTDRERAQTDRERAQTAVAEEQLRQLCRTADEESHTTEGCALVQRMTSLLLRSL